MVCLWFKGMAPMAKSDTDQEKGDEVLRRLLKTPPQPKQEPAKQKEKRAPKSPKREVQTK